jgi:hypothetical protein
MKIRNELIFNGINFLVYGLHIFQLRKSDPFGHPNDAANEMKKVRSCILWARHGTAFGVRISVQLFELKTRRL